MTQIEIEQSGAILLATIVNPPRVLWILRQNS